MSETANGNTYLICSNCGATLQEGQNFCPECGQDVKSHKRPVLHFFLETLENTFHFDTKLLHTLRDLIVHPGLATLNYNEDKRARYVPPVRLYVFLSFIFFLTVNLMDMTAISIPEPAVQFSEDGTRKEAVEFVSDKEQELLKSKTLDNKTLDSLLISKGSEPTLFNRSVYRILNNSMMGKGETEEFKHKAFKNISISLIFLMPLAAFIIQLFYLKKKKFYIEHLIFSLHFHSLLFTFLLFGLLVLALFDFNIIPLVFIVMVPYMIIALRRVYGGNIWLTILKSGLILTIYLAFIAFAFAIVTVATYL